MTLEDGGGMAVALEDGGGMVVLGGGIGQRLRIVVAALGGGDRTRRCNDGISISVVKAKGLLL